MTKNLPLQDLHHWHCIISCWRIPINLLNIEKDLQHFLHDENLYQQTVHPYHDVPELEQDYDMGSRNWILNRDLSILRYISMFWAARRWVNSATYLYKSSIITSCMLLTFMERDFLIWNLSTSTMITNHENW